MKLYKIIAILAIATALQAIDVSTKIQPFAGLTLGDPFLKLYPQLCKINGLETIKIGWNKYDFKKFCENEKTAIDYIIKGTEFRAPLNDKKFKNIFYGNTDTSVLSIDYIYLNGIKMTLELNFRYRGDHQETIGTFLRTKDYIIKYNDKTFNIDAYLIFNLIDIKLYPSNSEEFNIANGFDKISKIFWNKYKDFIIIPNLKELKKTYKEKNKQFDLQKIKYDKFMHSESINGIEGGLFHFNRDGYVTYKHRNIYRNDRLSYEDYIKKQATKELEKNKEREDSSDLF